MSNKRAEKVKGAPSVFFFNRNPSWGKVILIPFLSKRRFGGQVTSTSMKTTATVTVDQIELQKATAASYAPSAAYFSPNQMNPRQLSCTPCQEQKERLDSTSSVATIYSHQEHQPNQGQQDWRNLMVAVDSMSSSDKSSKGTDTAGREKKRNTRRLRRVPKRSLATHKCPGLTKDLPLFHFSLKRSPLESTARLGR